LFKLRRELTNYGLEVAKKLNITESEVRELFNKYHYDDDKSYEELMSKRKDLSYYSDEAKITYELLYKFQYKAIRVAYCPCLDPCYSWCSDLDKAGITKAQQEEFAYEKMKEYIK